MSGLFGKELTNSEWMTVVDELENRIDDWNDAGEHEVADELGDIVKKLEDGKEIDCSEVCNTIEELEVRANSYENSDLEKEAETIDKICGNLRDMAEKMEKPAKRLESVSNGIAELEVVECASCGFHLGIDATYLIQVGDLNIPCPNCGSIIPTRVVCPE